MAFPGNYGFVPHTQSADGEPIDVLVCNTRPLLPGCVINVRPIGILVMEDNLGVDEKIIAVPSPHLTRRYDGVTNYSDVPTITLQQIEHFFEHYKDLEEGKWVKIGDWGDAAAARRAIGEAIARAAGRLTALRLETQQRLAATDGGGHSRALRLRLISSLRSNCASRCWSRSDNVRSSSALSKSRTAFCTAPIVSRPRAVQFHEVAALVGRVAAAQTRPLASSCFKIFVMPPGLNTSVSCSALGVMTCGAGSRRSTRSVTNSAVVSSNRARKRCSSSVCRSAAW